MGHADESSQKQHETLQKHTLALAAYNFDNEHRRLSCAETGAKPQVQSAERELQAAQESLLSAASSDARAQAMLAWTDAASDLDASQCASASASTIVSTR